MHGLLALCELTAARFPARTGPDGTPILLEDQDRRLWDFSAIRRGLAALARASSLAWPETRTRTSPERSASIDRSTTDSVLQP